MDRMDALRGAEMIHSKHVGGLASSSPMETEIPDRICAVVTNHMGLTKDQVRSAYDMITLGELKFVAHRERQPSIDVSEVVPAQSVAHEVVDASRLGPQARAVTAWEAGLLMAEYLREHGRPILTGRTIIEVGAGIGLVGFAAAECADAATIVLTDGNDTAVSLLHTNKELNEPWFGGEGGQNVHVRTLHWDNEEDCADTRAAYGPFNAVLGADVLYSAPAAQSLARLLPKLLEGSRTGATGAGPQPLLLLAHEVRHHNSPGLGVGQDDALSAFLNALCLPSSQSQTGLWELTAQSLVKGDVPYNVDVEKAGKPDLRRIGSMPRTDSGTVLNVSAAMRINKPASKPDLHALAHVRAEALPSPIVTGEAQPKSNANATNENDDEEEQNQQAPPPPTMQDIIRQAVTRPHGSFLLLTLTPATGFSPA